jgi:hypothetical protein
MRKDKDLLVANLGQTMNRTKKTQSHSTNSSRFIDPERLNILNEQIADNIQIFFEYFDYEEYTQSGNKITGSCPVHGGDHPSGFNMWVDGHSFKGNWKCRSHGCESKWFPSALGFVRGCLSRMQNGKEISLYDAASFASGLLNQDLSDIKVDRTRVEKKQYQKLVSYFNEKPMDCGNKLNREQVKRGLQIPSQYFLGRGYSRSILERYDVGDCYARGKEMYLRAVAPIYDDSGECMVGCSGRSFYDKCGKCKMHHHPDSDCPSKEYYAIYCKWKHQKGFRAENWLYNIWEAKDIILETGWAILVESPGNVWRLEEFGIQGSLGMFSTTLTPNQRLVLDASGALNVLIVPDNGEAGMKGAMELAKSLENRYNTDILDPFWDDDVGSITSDNTDKKNRLIESIKNATNGEL